MKNKLHINQVPYLFAALCIALFSLIAFQINWISQSRNLIEQQFDQKVDLALGSTISEINSIYDNSYLDMDNIKNCRNTDDCKYIQVNDESVSNYKIDDLRSVLSTNMQCYGVGDNYKVSFVNENVSKPKENKSYTCSLNPLSSCDDEAYITLSFPNKSDYLFDRMKFMIGSSILIFLLLSTVSFIILWSLIKQKRITENNIDFFNNTAHELKTPLTNISLALNLLGRKYDSLKDDQYAQIIKRENTKLADQIERVLYLSKIENGEYNIKKENLNLKDLISEVVNHMQMIVAEKNGVIHLNLPSENYIVRGDRYHLSNVFKNLIDNSLKYCDKKPVIEISIMKAYAGIKLVFSDNGIGISKHDQEHIFEKFQRVNTGDVRDAKGFGIGLSYVKKVIEMHKGIIKVLSEKNHGSQFELYIPNN